MSEVTTDETTDDCSTASTSACGDCMTKDIIAMILQYLNASGFEQSYKIFLNECKSYGFPLPRGLEGPQHEQQLQQEKGEELHENFPQDLSAQLNFGPRESNLLFKYFDSEEANLLLEQWAKFMAALDEEHKQDFKKITFFVRIFAAIIPFRKNESVSKKAEALAELRDFFQEKSDEFATDEKMLSLFALPFVGDPAIHPIFKDIFRDSWKSKLRIQMKLSIKRYCEFKNVPTPSSCDLVQLYMTTTMRDDDVDVQEERSMLRCTESADDRKAIQDKFNKLESTLLDVEMRYHKLLKVTAEMVAALEAAVEGRDRDMSALKGRVTSVFPELFNVFQQQQSTLRQEQEDIQEVEGNQSDDYEEDDDDDDSFSEPEPYDTDSELGPITNETTSEPVQGDDSTNNSRDHVISSPKYSSSRNKNSANCNNEVYYEPTSRARPSPPRSSSKVTVQENSNRSGIGDGLDCTPLSTRQSKTRAIDKGRSHSKNRDSHSIIDPTEG